MKFIIPATALVALTSAAATPPLTERDLTLPDIGARSPSNPQENHSLKPRSPLVIVPENVNAILEVRSTRPQRRAKTFGEISKLPARGKFPHRRAPELSEESAANLEDRSAPLQPRATSFSEISKLPANRGKFNHFRRAPELSEEPTAILKDRSTPVEERGLDGSLEAKPRPKTAFRRVALDVEDPTTVLKDRSTPVEERGLDGSLEAKPRPKTAFRRVALDVEDPTTVLKDRSTPIEERDPKDSPKTVEMTDGKPLPNNGGLFDRRRGTLVEERDLATPIEERDPKDSPKTGVMTDGKPLPNNGGLFNRRRGTLVEERDLATPIEERDPQDSPKTGVETDGKPLPNNGGLFNRRRGTLVEERDPATPIEERDPQDSPHWGPFDKNGKPTHQRRYVTPGTPIEERDPQGSPHLGFDSPPKKNGGKVRRMPLEQRDTATPIEERDPATPIEERDPQDSPHLGFYSPPRKNGGKVRRMPLEERDTATPIEERDPATPIEERDPADSPATPLGYYDLRRGKPVHQRRQGAPAPIPSFFPPVDNRPLPPAPAKKNHVKKRRTPVAVESAEKREADIVGTLPPPSTPLKDRDLLGNGDLDDVRKLLNGGTVSKRQFANGPGQPSAASDYLKTIPRPKVGRRGSATELAGNNVPNLKREEAEKRDLLGNGDLDDVRKLLNGGTVSKRQFANGPGEPSAASDYLKTIPRPKVGRRGSATELAGNNVPNRKREEAEKRDLLGNGDLADVRNLLNGGTVPQD